MSEFEDKLNSILSDPAQMGKIADMAKSLMGGQSREEEAKEKPDRSDFSQEPGLDMAAITKISKILSEVKNESDDKTALLKAMEPYLNEKRRAKMEKGVKLLKLARLAKLAMGELGGDENV